MAERGYNGKEGKMTDMAEQGCEDRVEGCCEEQRE